jgi:signal recognition particle subunit SRP54
MQQVRKMGGLSSLIKMMPTIPGMGRLSDAQVDEKDMVRIEAIIRSMTPHERREPRVLTGSRRSRVARGSGTSVREVNDLLKQFDAARKMMKQFGGMAGIGGMGGKKKGKKGGFQLPPGLGL